MRILLDTNVILRATEPKHEQHSNTVTAIGTMQGYGHELVIVPQVLYEFWSVATRPLENNGLGMSPVDAQREMTTLQRLFRLLRDERMVFAAWEQLVVSLNVRGKQAHDARIAAAMQRHGITHLLTFNVADFTRFAFLTAVSPSDSAALAALNR